MATTSIPRRLRFQDGSESKEGGQELLVVERRSLVVLGESGMGKSTLLTMLGQVDGYRVCTARKLVNHPQPADLLGDAITLVVDALDEVAAGRDGAAVDLVVRRLAELGGPRFVLSCRAADWQGATSIEALSAFYEPRPLEVHLEPFRRDDALTFLSMTLGEDGAEEVLTFLESRDLEDLWGNPQTLGMVADVAARGPLPASKGELFEAAVHVMCEERNRLKGDTPLNRMPREEVLDAAGAAFAALLLTGSEALSRLPAPDGDDLPLRELTAFPGAGRLGDIFGARLFSAPGVDRFGYVHRAVGEFLGARWLVRQADTQRKRRRLLALFGDGQLVPTNLRGLHAWLAWHARNDSDLGVEVVRADPMGVVEYGEADALRPTQATAMFDALKRLSREDPFFLKRNSRLRGMAQQHLKSRLLEALRDTDVQVVLRLAVLQALKGSELADEAAKEVHAVLMNRDALFTLRSEAAEVLTRSRVTQIWAGLVSSLLGEGGEYGPQLAMELVCDVGPGAFEDTLLLATVLGQLERAETHVWVYRRFGEVLPVERAAALLDGLATFRAGKAHFQTGAGSNDLNDLVFRLVAARMRVTPVEPARFWSWVGPFARNPAIRNPSWAMVADVLQVDRTFRDEVQRHVVLEPTRPADVASRVSGLAPLKELRLDEEDVVRLLDGLDPVDARWRELVRSVGHSPSTGADVRHAAARLATGDADRQWLFELSQPYTPHWVTEQQEEARQRDIDNRNRWATHREDFRRQLAGVTQGRDGLLVNAAEAYLGMRHDLYHEGADGPSKLDAWLGSDLRDACLAGFEAFLGGGSPTSTASDIAESEADGKCWPVARVLVAALMERRRRVVGFADLPEERVMSGFLGLKAGGCGSSERHGELAASLADELTGRGAWERTLRFLVEPRLGRGADATERLSYLADDEKDRNLGLRLADEWLRTYPGMDRDTESELLDLLLRNGRHAALEELAPTRGQDTSDPVRTLTWQSVGIIVDFEATSRLLDARGAVEADMLWKLRRRLQERPKVGPRVRLRPEQLAWVVGRFRSLFPAVPRPMTAYGDEHPWDAHEFLNGLISRLGEETSDAAVGLLAGLGATRLDDYTDHLKAVAAEQKRRKVEETYEPPSLETVRSAMVDLLPTMTAQLQAVVVDALDDVQQALEGSDVDWYRDFYEAGRPRKEDDCRDTLLKMLRPLLPGIETIRERHLGDDKRCDIACMLPRLLVPIEVKGQWHDHLWTAADHQLDRLYNNDQHADRGIFLVFWFGKGSGKDLKLPPAGTSVPGTPEELREALTATSEAVRRGRVRVVVLDLVRPG